VQVLETVGPQEYELKPELVVDRFAAAYGAQPAAELSEHYS
jgi:hypothetical protein